MNTTEKNKLRHDFMNAIVVINSMTKSASSFLNKLSTPSEQKELQKKQMENFLYSMTAIREQTAKLENYFETILSE